MKCFPAFLLVALTSTTWSVVLAASIGVRKGVSEPQAPAPPQIDISVSGSLFAATVGESGGSTANQQVEEHVIGDAQIPASLHSLSGVNAEAALLGSIDGIIIANPEEQTSGTLNDVFVENALASSDDLQVHLNGAHEASVDNSGETSIFGGGIIAATGNTSNNLNNEGMKV